MRMLVRSWSCAMALLLGICCALQAADYTFGDSHRMYSHQMNALAPRSGIASLATKWSVLAEVLKTVMFNIAQAKQQGQYPRQIARICSDLLKERGFPSPVTYKTIVSSGKKSTEDMYRFYLKKIPVMVFYDNTTGAMSYAIGHFRHRSEGIAPQQLAGLTQEHLASQFSSLQPPRPAQASVAEYWDWETVNDIVPGRKAEPDLAQHPDVSAGSLAAELLSFRPLTKGLGMPDEIRLLAAEIQGGNLAARQALAEAHGRFIVGQARRYRHVMAHRNELDRLVSELYLAALRAAKTYDPDQGTFITYLTKPFWDVTKRMMLKEKAENLGISSRLAEKIPEYMTLKEELGRDPMIGEIAGRLRISPHQARQLSVAMNISLISYEEWMDREREKEDKDDGASTWAESERPPESPAGHTRYLEDPDVSEMLTRLEQQTGIGIKRWATFLLYKGILKSRMIQGDADSGKVADLFDVSGQRSRKVIQEMTERLREQAPLREILSETLTRREEFFPTIGLEEARETIRAIFEQKDPTKMLHRNGMPVHSFKFTVYGVGPTYLTFSTARGPRKLTSGSKKDRGDITVEVRYAPGIGYVFETDKTVKEKNHFYTAKTINREGKYVNLDKIPGYWAKQFDLSLEREEYAIPEIRWKTVMRILLRNKNLGQGLPFETGGTPALFKGFRFRVPKAGEEFLQLRNRDGDKVKLLSGSEDIGDLNVLMRFAHGIGYVLEMEKRVPGKDAVETVRVIDDNAKFEWLNEIPGYWQEEIQQSMADDQVFLSPVKWKTIVEMLWRREDPRAPLWIIQAQGAKTALLGFRFVLSKVKTHFYSPALPDGQKYMYSGSKITGNMTALVQLHPHDGYIFNLVKVTPDGTFPSRRVIRDGVEGRDFYLHPEISLQAEPSPVEVAL